MKELHPTHLLTTALTVCLCSCQVEPPTPAVPEMPYRPRIVTLPQQEEAPTTTTWETAPEPSPYISETADGALKKTPSAPAAAPPPATTPARTTITTLPDPEPEIIPPPIKPLDINDFTPTTTGTPAAPQKTASAAATTTPTQNGPIPIAARVEGDPTRVWNPMDPSKKILIIDPNTNKPYPSGKVLRVGKHNFFFIVP